VEVYDGIGCRVGTASPLEQGTDLRYTKNLPAYTGSKTTEFYIIFPLRQRMLYETHLHIY